MNTFYKSLIINTICFGFAFVTNAQNYAVFGTVSNERGERFEGASILIKDTNLGTISDEEGNFRIPNVPKGEYEIAVSYIGANTVEKKIKVDNKAVQVNFQLAFSAQNLEAVVVKNKSEKTLGITRLRAVEGVGIYASKKTEVVVLGDLTANLATNMSRQIYSKVVGLNIWESDGAGVQLGIGGRGLSPNRNANFNTRQNGYDISADALGYPESYYAPPTEAIEKIEIIRGAASLQFGTQFGGMLNFKFKEGPKDKKIELTSRQTVGSFGLFTSFNSVGGTIGKVNYYGFYQYKKSKGWRPNSSLDQHTAHFSAKIKVNERFSIRPEYTFTTYLAQQPGGLTDAQFDIDPQQSNRERNWFQVDWNLFALTLDYVFSDRTKLNSRTFGLIAGRDALGNLDRINTIDFGDNRDFLSDDFNNWGNETRLIHKYTLFDNPAVFLIGTRLYKGFTHRRQGEGNNGATADFIYNNPNDLEGSDFDLPSANIAAFAENIFNVTEKWSVTPGIRFEYINTETDGYYKQTTKDLAGNILSDERILEAKSNARSFLLFGLGTSYKPNESLEIYGNFSQNFRAINFNDIRVSVGNLVVDPNLKDEKGFTTDLGLRGNYKGLLNYDFTLFYLAYKDRIGNILKKEPNPNFNGLVERIVRFRSNIADADIYGFESFAELNLLKLTNFNIEDTRLSVFGNFALLNATYSNSEENGIEGNDVELVPPFNLKAGLNFEWKNFTSTMQYSLVGEHFSDASNAIRTPSAIEGIIPSYHVMDLSFSYKYKFLQLETGINNLSNNFYFTRRATGYPGPGIIPSDGRSFYVTLQVKI
jgi:Fe(3+) dicitrate transport protein